MFNSLTSLSETNGDLISLVIKVKDQQNKFVIGSKYRLATVTWDGVSSKSLVPEHLVDVQSKDATTILNDGKCDPSNRLWAGMLYCTF